jgi:hypothetical protein
MQEVGQRREQLPSRSVLSPTGSRLATGLNFQAPGSGLNRRCSIYGQGVNITLHQVTHGLVHESMALHHGLPDELPRYDFQAKMSTPVLCSFVPAMQVAFINNLKELRLQSHDQALANLLHAFLGIHGGMTRIKGETSTFSYTPAAT